jgi:tetratricopeptide (TPR) repeat protein
MTFASRSAAMHIALWSIDRGYRLWWYVWPLSMAVLICGSIYFEKPASTSNSSSASWGKPAPSANAQSATGPAVAAKKPAAQTMGTFPDRLRNDALACYSNSPDVGKPIEFCSRMIESRLLNDEQLAAAHNQRGLYYYSTTLRDRAISDYDAALKIQPDNPAVLTNRSLIYMERGQIDAALSDLNKAIELLMPALAARAIVQSNRLRHAQGLHQSHSRPRRISKMGSGQFRGIFGAGCDRIRPKAL